MYRLINASSKADKTKLYDLMKKEFEDNPDKLYDITIKRHAIKRTQKQNRYYHGVIIQILVEFTGAEHDVIHDYLKFKFLSIPDNFEGTEFTVSRSTTDLNVKEFEEYCEKIRLWADEHYGLIIPAPNANDLTFNPYQPQNPQIAKK